MDRPSYGVGLYDCAIAQGYRWVGDRCMKRRAGRPIEPHDFRGKFIEHGDGLRFRRSGRESTAFETSHLADVDVLIRGHLDEPRIDGSASELPARLYTRGRVSQFRYGAVTVGSIDPTPDSHPIDVDGQPQERIWLFGVLTEGVRQFTQYIPSPRSRIRAFEELGACVTEILA